MKVPTLDPDLFKSVVAFKSLSKCLFLWPLTLDPLLWDHKDRRRGHGRGIWKSILQGKEVFKNFIKFKMRLGAWFNNEDQ